MAGSIRVRTLKDGTKRYQARFPHPHPDPRKKTNQDLTETFNNPRDAKLWLARQNVKYADDPHHNPDRAKTPFATLVDDWQRVRFGALAPKSRARYEQVIRTHLTPEFGRARVGDITRDWVRDFLAALAAETTLTQLPNGQSIERPKYATGTVLKVRTTLSSIMSEAVERGYAQTNPCHGIRGLPKDEPRKMLFLTPAEVHALADAMPTPTDKTLVLVAAYTGLRAGELHALRTKDVDLLRGRITVTRALKAWRDTTPIFGLTKTEKPRGVDLPPEIRDLLASHLASTPGGAMRKQPATKRKQPGAQPTAEALVFTNSEGGAIQQVSWLRNHYKPAVAKVLPQYAADPADPDRQTLRFHDLRHTYISFLIAAGIHPKAIQEQAGHASITTTMDRYGHLLDAAGEGVKNALSGTFAQGQAPANVTQLKRAQ